MQKKKCKAENLTNRDQYETMGVDGEPVRWISCPACASEKLLRVPLDARAYRIPVYCKRCRRFVEVNIDQQ